MESRVKRSKLANHKEQVGAFVGRSVATASDKGLVDLLEAHRLVEGEAAALAAITISDEKLQGLCRLLTDDRSSPTEQTGRAFHVAIAAATENAVLTAMVDQLWASRERLRINQIFHAANEGARETILGVRAQILDALKLRDACSARSGMHSYVDHLSRSVFEVMEQQAIRQAQEKADALRATLLKRYPVR